MKALIVDNIAANRSMMSKMLKNQTAVPISNILEAPNRIMGAMLIEAVEFDLVVLGGVLENVLPDGTIDMGNGVALASQLLQRRPFADLVLWSDNEQVKQKFYDLLSQQDREVFPYICWPKQISKFELETNLLQLFSAKSQTPAASSTHHQEI